jgi:hypothetical protein
MAEPPIPETWQAGATSFVTIPHEKSRFAVVKGKTLEDLKYVFKIKPAEGKFYFINMSSKAKTWELPDCYPNDRSASADAAAKQGSSGDAKVAANNDLLLLDQWMSLIAKKSLIVFVQST